MSASIEHGRHKIRGVCGCQSNATVGLEGPPQKLEARRADVAKPRDAFKEGLKLLDLIASHAREGPAGWPSIPTMPG